MTAAFDELFEAPELLIFGASDLHTGRRSFGMPQRSAFRGLTQHIIHTQQRLGIPVLLLLLGDFLEYYVRSPEHNAHRQGHERPLTRRDIVQLVDGCYTSQTAMDQGLSLRKAPGALAEWAALGLQHLIGPSRHSPYYRTLAELGLRLGAPVVWFGHTHQPLTRPYLRPNGKNRRKHGGFSSRTTSDVDLLLMNGGNWNTNGSNSTPYLQARIHKGRLTSTALKQWTAGGPVTVGEYQRQQNRRSWTKVDRSRRRSRGESVTIH